MVPRQIEDGETYLPFPGGAIFNTAIALGRLGQPTGFVSGLSTDPFGQQLTDALADAGVDTSLCHRTDLHSTLAFVKLTDGVADYSFFDENSAGRQFSKSDLPDLPSTASAIHFGAISLIPEPCGSAYEELVNRYSQQCVISFDPNIRSPFIKDENSYRARIERLITKIDIMKVSDEDFDWIACGNNNR